MSDSSNLQVPAQLPSGLPAAPPDCDGPAQTRRRRAAKTRPRDDWRLILVMFTFVLVYAAVGFSMGLMALKDPVEPRLASDGGAGTPVRGEITDRNGSLLAANLPAFSLYAHPREIKDPSGVAHDLAGIFPEMSAGDLTAMLSRAS